MASMSHFSTKRFINQSKGGSSLVKFLWFNDYLESEGSIPMNKKTKKILFILTLLLMLSGCSGLGNHTKSTDDDDGFYQWGKGKNDRSHSY